MARPRTPTYSGDDADRKWAQVEAARKEAGLKVVDMADKIGVAGESAWFKWQARRRMPVEVWARFENVRDLLRGFEEQLDDTVLSHELLNRATEFGEGDIKEVLKIRASFEGLIHVNGIAREVVFSGKPRKCDWPKCNRAFIPRSWNHSVCDRAWHRQQERERREREREARTI